MRTDLLLELEAAVEQGLGGGGAPGDVNVDRDDPVAAAHHLEKNTQKFIHQSSDPKPRNAGTLWWFREHAVLGRFYRVGVVVVAATVGAGAHGDDPLGLRHLVVHLAERRGHLQGRD